MPLSRYDSRRARLAQIAADADGSANAGRRSSAPWALAGWPGGCPGRTRSACSPGRTGPRRARLRPGLARGTPSRPRARPRTSSRPGFARRAAAGATAIAAGSAAPGPPRSTRASRPSGSCACAARRRPGSAARDGCGRSRRGRRSRRRQRLAAAGGSARGGRRRRCRRSQTRSASARPSLSTRHPSINRINNLTQS